MDPVKRGLGLQPQVVNVELVVAEDREFLPVHLRSVLTCVRIIAALPARPFPVSWQHKGNV